MIKGGLGDGGWLLEVEEEEEEEFFFLYLFLLKFCICLFKKLDLFYVYINSYLYV